MAVMIDANLLLLENIDTAATVTSSVLDIGKNNSVNPLYVAVKLTKGVSSGNVASVKLQSSATEDFGTPIEEMTVTIGKTAEQQKKTCTLAQFFCPIQPGGRYIRIIVTGTAPTGGKLWAYLSTDVQVPIV